MTSTLTKWYEEHGRHEIFAGGKKVGLEKEATYDLVLNDEHVNAAANDTFEKSGVAKNSREEKIRARDAKIKQDAENARMAKLYRKEIEARHATRYRRYLGRRDVSGKAHLLRQQRGRKILQSPRGSHYNLEAIFEDLNQRFFHGLLARPLMTWSRHDSRQSLGHYDPAHNTIVISRVFDRADMPRYAVEYLVYHEMLHLKHPVRLNGSRRCVHPKAFQDEERLFPELEKAKELLKRL